MKTEYAEMKTRNGRPGPVLQGVTATARVEGLLLTTTLRQAFRNDTDDVLEVSYTFPLAWDAVLLDLTAQIGELRRTGRVLPRAESERRYEEAVSSGDAAILVHPLGRGMFNMSLGNLKPGETAELEFRYAQLLRFEQGRIRIAIPTTIAPRYGDAAAQAGLRHHEQPVADARVEHPFQLAVELHGEVARAQVASPTHAITSSDAEGGVRRVALASSAWLDRDFVLLLEGLPMRAFALAGADPQAGGNATAVIASYAPPLPPAPPRALNLKILVDCSGSMEGVSMAQARTALGQLVNALDAEDGASFSRFGSAVSRVIAPTSASVEGRARLEAAIAATEANMGGTEMHAALVDTLALAFGPDARDAPADVLVITDGDVWDVQRIVALAAASGQRLHALGVGSAPAESLLRELAEATGGGCELVSPGEDMAQAVQRLVARMRLARALPLAVQWSAPVLWAAPVPGLLMEGETLHVAARLGARPSEPPVLGVAAPHDVPPCCAEGLRWIEGDLVPRLVAAQQMAGCEEDEARALAVRYQLVGPFTNLLLVAEREAGERTDGMPVLHVERSMLATGWGGIAAAASIDACEHLDLSYDATLSAHEDFEDTVDPAGPDGAALAALLRAVNAAVAAGENLRRSLQLATQAGMDDEVATLLVQVGREVQGPLNAWALFLLWLDASAPGGERLGAAAKALAQAQLAGIELHERIAGELLLEAAALRWPGLA